MSCTPGPEGVTAGDDCDSVLHDVWLFLDNELDPERRAAIQRHLDDCSPCLEQAGIDTKLKALLARKCGGDHAPSHLRERIVTRLVAWSADAEETDAGTTAETVTVSGTAVTVSVDEGPARH